ncbi:NAD(P)H-dependent oxidoreductase [Saccharibacillus sp. CPCC 101409]|uniref:NAD(P)H-dependent oxidoreductase n=1 Tax=Saccharibacillus sp. CPCC 101409 TaxID=3058041 RepID=UPI002673C2EE|nr:NAD(P)H-dependent oxidoreductase [Saccharibacillus sp. CPCC 101409]MDO3410413.1 NAD(P)H-dependent oxidoreductase [Saccharibacillus sp. CPCC 101409]
MKTLVILAHPNLNVSRVNRRWKEELLRHADRITLHELYPEYPDWTIDAAREQRLLEEHERVVLQFPLYWYSYPPLLKKWFDDVFAYGWAYGSSGDRLKGKQIGLAMSIGDKRRNYEPDGSVSFTVEEVIVPFTASLRHVGATALPHFAAFGASFGASDEEIKRSAKDYARYVLSEDHLPRRSE